MNYFTETIVFVRGLDQLNNLNRQALQNRLMKILGVTSKASLSRHATGVSRTSFAKQVKIGNEFIKMGITNWRGARKKTKKSHVHAV